MKASIVIQRDTLRITDILVGDTLSDLITSARLFASKLYVPDFEGYLFVHTRNKELSKPIYFYYEKRYKMVVFRFGDRN